MNVRKRFRPGVAAESGDYKWWALSCTSLGMLLVATNSGTLIIALPDLERSLGTGLLELVWVILAYMISSTVLVLTAGRLSDLFGRKSAYVGGFVVSGLASLGAGFSANGTELILWRIVQGVGGAFLFANAAALVTDAFPRERLGLAMGTNTMVAATAGVSLLRPHAEPSPERSQRIFDASHPKNVATPVGESVAEAVREEIEATP